MKSRFWYIVGLVALLAAAATIIGLLATARTSTDTTVPSMPSASAEAAAAGERTCAGVLAALREVMSSTTSGLAPRTSEQEQALSQGLAALSDPAGLCPLGVAQSFRSEELGPWLVATPSMDSSDQTPSASATAP